MGVNKIFNRSGSPSKRGPKVSGDSGGFKNPFRRGPKVTGDSGKIGRLKNPFRRGPKITGDVGGFGKIGKAFTRFGKSAIPIAGAALGAADAAIRVNEGDVTGASIAGTSATLDAISAGLTATGIGIFPAAVLSAVSFGLDLVNLVRDLSGASDREAKKRKRERAENRGSRNGETEIQKRLREETEKQKERSNKSQPKVESGELTFGKTLDGYERVIKKFEEFSNIFKIGTTGEDGVNYPDAPNITPDMEYTGPITGETFFPLPGGSEGQQANQQFGAPRDGGTRPHKGLDMIKRTGNIEAPVVAYKTGRVVESVKAGYNGYVTISHGKGLATRYYHINPLVSVGQTVYGGEQIGTLFNDGENTHLHFEVIANGTKVDPKRYGTGRNRITSPLSRDRAKEHEEKSEKPKDQKSTQRPVSADPVMDESQRSIGGMRGNIKPTTTSVTISGYTYEKRGNKFYENGQEISEQLMRSVIKNHSSKFKGWISRNIEVDTDRSKVAFVMVPTPIPSQQQPPQMNGGGSNFMMLNNDVNRVVANLSYNKTLLLS